MRMAYYEAVAQVIPIILLALAFETRGFDPIRTYSGGEPKPLSLAADRDTLFATGVTAHAVSCGGVAVIALLSSRQREATRRADRSTWSIAIATAAGLVAGLTAILASLLAY